MLRTSFDQLFWQDTSPEYQEYLNTSWSEPDAPIHEAMAEALEAFRRMGESMGTIAETYAKAWGNIFPRYKPPYEPVGPAYHYAVDEAGKVIVGNAGAEAIIPIQPIFTDDLGRIEGGPGASTHDDRGRPRLDSSGGVPRDVQPFARCHHWRVVARCRRCRR